MKKMHLSAMALAIFLLQGHSPSPLKTTVNQATTSAVPAASKDVLSYTWFMDENYTDPTGTVSSINVELNRLRNLYPWFIFSSTPGVGLLQYEFGYHPVLFDAVIYSNMYW